MSIDKKLYERSGSKCELCGSSDDLKIYLTKLVKMKQSSEMVTTIYKEVRICLEITY